tara:strand:+ start:77 stop:451 length:375 start_codon:yes stop_codon:yes gene_type:complete
MGIQTNDDDGSIHLTLFCEGDVQQAVEYLLGREDDLWYIDVDVSSLMFQEMLINDLLTAFRSLPISAALLRKFGWIREIKDDLDKKKITLNILGGMLFEDDSDTLDGDDDDYDSNQSGNLTGND